MSGEKVQLLTVLGAHRPDANAAVLVGERSEYNPGAGVHLGIWMMNTCLLTAIISNLGMCIVHRSCLAGG